MKVNARRAIATAKLIAAGKERLVARTYAIEAAAYWHAEALRLRECIRRRAKK